MVEPTGKSPHAQDVRIVRAGPATERRVLAACTVVILAVTVLQRVALPLGAPVALSMLVVLPVLGWLLYLGDVVEHTRALRVYLMAVAGCCLAAIGAFLLGAQASVPSLLLLVVVWSAFCFRVHPAAHHLYPRVLDRFEKIMMVFAVVGIGQVLAQFAGVWAYRDYVKEALPLSFTFAGYNTSYPIQYGSSVIKANAFVFVEPSIFSQFLALALLSTLVRGARPLRVLLFAGALVCAVAGTGLLLMAVGLLVLAVRRGGWWTVRVAGGGAVLLVAALSTPLGDIFVDRSDETSYTNSSASLRFVQPFQFIERTWREDPVTFLTGLGPGGADAAADAVFAATGLPLNFAGAPKLVLEYGVPASVLFVVFVVVAVLRRAPSPTLAIGGVFANSILFAGLLQPQVLYLLLPLCTLFVGSRFDAGRRRGAAAHRDTAREASAPAPVRPTLQPAAPNGLGTWRP